MYAGLTQTKFCNFCKQAKSTTEFYRNCGTHDKLASKCKSCDLAAHKVYVEKNRDKVKMSRQEFRKANKVRLSVAKNRAKCPPERFKELFEAQQGQCAICGLHQDKMRRRIAIDHNHTTKAIRGLLCDNCNRCLGLLKDSTLILEKALGYLRKYEK